MNRMSDVGIAMTGMILSGSVVVFIPLLWKRLCENVLPKFIGLCY